MLVSFFLAGVNYLTIIPMLIIVGREVKVIFIHVFAKIVFREGLLQRLRFLIVWVLF